MYNVHFFMPKILGMLNIVYLLIFAQSAGMNINFQEM